MIIIRETKFRERELRMVILKEVEKKEYTVLELKVTVRI
jgi:hypothetical protein